MFKTAASKLAHNTTLPVLGGNQDLRPLQDLITSEKSVLIVLQKLSTDYSKGADALRTWGQAEGDDLGDILNASTALLTLFSSALSQYAAHGHTIREHLKAVRSREEALDELRRRRRSVHRKADDADRKLHKMGPEHKNLDIQTELLHRLQDEIRSLDSEIMTEEAQLGDFKRTCARRWLGLKFGGLMECCEKGTIIGEYGKRLVSEIPEDVTQPGMPRSLYYGHNTVNSLITEATRSIDQVSLSTAPSDARRSLLPLPPHDESFDSPIADGTRGLGAPTLDFPAPYAASINTLPTPSKGPPFDGPASVDDFGMRHDTNAGRFATFPAKLRQDSLPTPSAPFASRGPPSLNPHHELGDSLTLSIAEALDAKKDAIGEGSADHPWRGRLSGEGGMPPPLSASAPLPSGGPDSTNPWATPPEQHQTLTVHKRNISDDDDALLAYMTSADVETSSDAHGESSESRLRVETQSSSPHLGDKKGSLESDKKPSRPASIKVEETETSEPQPKHTITRAPPLALDSEKDERALNAAAARELSREIEAAAFTPPTIPSLSQQEANPPHDQEPERGREQNLTVTQPDRDHSPLVPPSAPFTQRAVSPHPFPEAPRTAAQVYAQSYQSSAGYNAQEAPPSAHTYPNPYEYSQDQYGVPPSNLPPRLQALQPAETQMLPPRFQGTRTGSSPVPPRFQAAHMQGQVAYSDNSLSDNRYPAIGGNNVPAETRFSLESPYRTPGECPAGTAGSPRIGNNFVSTSPPRLQPGSPSLSTAPSPLVPSGGRTISAAAFKRPQPLPSKSVDNLSFSDPRRTVSGSPYAPQGNNNPNVNAPPAQTPAQQQFGENYGENGNNGTSTAIPPSLVGGISGSGGPGSNDDLQPRSQAHQRVSRDLPPPPPGAAAPIPEPEDDYHFDYISAYEQEQDGGSPRTGQFSQGVQQEQGGGGRAVSGYYGGAGAQGPGPGYPQRLPEPQPPHGHAGGYGTGRYAADLDRGLR